MAEALRALELELKTPPPDYRPPVSTFPLTKAAKAALGTSGGLRLGRRLAPWRKPATRRTPAGHDERPSSDTEPANPHGSDNRAGNERGLT